jgi:deoxyribose-phosphate aldolase
MREYIEHTLLHPTASAEDFERLAQEAVEFSFFGVCVPPYWVKKVARDLQGSEVRVVTVAGFPLGYSMASVKVAEAVQAMADGAHEVDMVLNLAAFRANPKSWAKPEVARMAQEVHQAGGLLKVILETAYLSDAEVVEACRLCQDAGADFVKTSTGFAPAGATEAHVRLMRQTVGNALGVKASGGIRTLEQAQAMVAAGADRLGTSAGVAICQGLPQ